MAFFLADADHGAGIGTIRGALQRYLVDDGGTVHQPADGADIGPGLGGVIEDRRVLGFARLQLTDQFFATDAQRLCGTVEVQAVTALVLHLGQQDGLAPQRRRAGDPVALGLHADHLGMRVLRNLPQQVFR